MVRVIIAALVLLVGCSPRPVRDSTTPTGEEVPPATEEAPAEAPAEEPVASAPPTAAPQELPASEPAPPPPPPVIPQATTQQLLAAFVPCEGTARIGQQADVPGATCSAVCTLFGFQSCAYRAGQADLNTCAPEALPQSGGCDDVFQPGWTSECVCATGE